MLKHWMSLESAPPRNSNKASSSLSTRRNRGRHYHRRSDQQEQQQSPIPLRVLTVYKPTTDTTFGLTMREYPGFGVLISRLADDCLVYKHHDQHDVEEAWPLVGSRVVQVNGQGVACNARQAGNLMAMAPVGWVTILVELPQQQQQQQQQQHEALQQQQQQHCHSVDNQLVVATLTTTQTRHDNDDSDTIHGLRLQQLLTGSVYVARISADSPWRNSPLGVGMHLVTINNQRVQNVAQAWKLLHPNEPGVITILAESALTSTTTAATATTAAAPLTTDTASIPTVHDVVALPCAPTDTDVTPATAVNVVVTTSAPNAE